TDPTVHDVIELHRDDFPEPLEQAVRDAELEVVPDVDGLFKVELSQLPAVAAEIERWLANEWQRWVGRERPRRRTINLYERLFRLRMRIEEEGAESATEVVWGLGRCIWNHPDAQIDYPLLTRRVEIELDKHHNLLVSPT